MSSDLETSSLGFWDPFLCPGQVSCHAHVPSQIPCQVCSLCPPVGRGPSTVSAAQWKLGTLAPHELVLVWEVGAGLKCVWEGHIQCHRAHSGLFW